MKKKPIKLGTSERNTYAVNHASGSAGLIGLILAGFVGLTFGVRHHSLSFIVKRRRYRAVELSALGRPNDLRHLNRRPRIRHELGFVPAPELGAVGSDDRDDATSSGARLRLALAESHCKPRAQENLETADLTVLSVMSALSCPLLLFLMWSPRGKMVFSPEYSETIRRTPGLRPGCSGIFPALAAVFAELISYFVLLLTVLSILVMLGLIRSI